MNKCENTEGPMSSILHFTPPPCGEVISIVMSDWKIHICKTQGSTKNKAKKKNQIKPAQKILEAGDIWLLKNGCYFLVFNYVYIYI